MLTHERAARAKTLFGSGGLCGAAAALLALRPAAAPAASPQAAARTDAAATTAASPTSAGQSPSALIDRADALARKARALEAQARAREAAGRYEQASDAYTSASTAYGQAGQAYALASGALRRAGQADRADRVRSQFRAAFADERRTFDRADAAHAREMAAIESGKTPADAGALRPAAAPAAPARPAPPRERPVPAAPAPPVTSSAARPAAGMAPGRAAGGPPPGTYYTLTFGFNWTAIPSSLGDIVLYGNGTYQALGERGEYVYDPGTNRVIWKTGALRHAVTYYRREAGGRPRLSFPRKENETAIDGHLIDKSDTSAYLKGAK